MQVGTNAANNLPGLVLSSIEADCCRNIEVNIFSFRHCKRDIEHIFYKISDLNFHSDHVLQNGSRVMLNFRDEVCLRVQIFLMAATNDLAISCYETSSEQHALSASRLNLTKEKHKGKMNQKYEAKSLANNCMNFDPPVPTE